MWGSNPLFLSEKLQVLSSFPILSCCAKDGVYGETVLASPTSFHVGLSSSSKA